MTVVTRFAPSPTGYLHIGGARTALFNYLYARANHGKFILRIEDTDKERSTQEATDAILHGMKWLGLDYDELFYQSNNIQEHIRVANELVAQEKAYYCFTSIEEIQTKRAEAEKRGMHFRFVSEWREKTDKKLHPKGVKPVIRLKAPIDGTMQIQDHVQGSVSVKCSQLDDMILLRSDRTPTYMLAVVVDDHQHGVTTIIRGDEHFNNAFRQKLIYDAMGWKTPEMSHIPLIHGMDGKKLSKRHGALGLDHYEDNGFLPEAIFNYLLRLGWSHGNDEIISKDQAISWFNLESLGKSPAKLDFDKMRSLNAHYIKASDNKYLLELASKKLDLNKEKKEIVLKSLELLKTRSQTISDLTNSAKLYILDRPIKKDETAKKIAHDFDKSLVEQIVERYSAQTQWTEGNLLDVTRRLASENNLKLGEMAQFIRAQLVGTTVSPSVFNIMYVLGRSESIARIQDY
ncbi:MAG: glutamate--tRNA ligase [Rickettsiales bacterium]